MLSGSDVKLFQFKYSIARSVKLPKVSGITSRLKKPPLK